MCTTGKRNRATTSFNLFLKINSEAVSSLHALKNDVLLRYLRQLVMLFDMLDDRQLNCMKQFW